MEKSININYKAIFAATFISFILGFLWYSPFAFGEIWAQGIGTTLEANGTPPIWAACINFLTIGLTSYGIAYWMQIRKLTGWQAGAKIGLFISFLFLFQILIGPWLFAGRFSLFLVNMGFFTISFVLTGIIIGSFQKAI